MSNNHHLALGVVQIVENGSECEEYKQWSEFFDAQQDAARTEENKMKLRQLFGIKHMDDNAFMVGLTSTLQILSDYEYKKKIKKPNFSDIYVVYASRGFNSMDLCKTVEMSFLAVTSANFPVVLHMGINRTFTFLLKNDCKKKTTENKIACKDGGLELIPKLAVRLHKFSAQFFADQYGEYPKNLEDAKKTKAKKYIISRPANLMRRILMQDEYMKSVMFVSDAMINNSVFEQDEDTLSWYAEHGSPVQDFEVKFDNGDEKWGCSFYSKAVECHQTQLNGKVFEIARWEKTFYSNGTALLQGFVCGIPLINPTEMEFLTSGDAAIRWLPYICFPCSCAKSDETYKTQTNQKRTTLKPEVEAI